MVAGMEDKDVGELRQELDEGLPYLYRDSAVPLIRKLVEEATDNADGDLDYVLHRFGIDPATWRQP